MAMRLKNYLTDRCVTPGALAKKLGIARWSVARYAAGLQIPESGIMVRIVRATDGAVMPNDFYALPARYR